MSKSGVVASRVHVDHDPPVGKTADLNRPEQGPAIANDPGQARGGTALNGPGS